MDKCHLLKTLAEIAFLTKETKRRCMVFQVEHKEQRAKDLGLPLWAFYHLAYRDLGILDSDRAATEWFNSHRTEALQAEQADFEKVHFHVAQIQSTET